MEEEDFKSPRQQALQQPLNTGLFRLALAEESRAAKKREGSLTTCTIAELESSGLAATGLYIDSIEQSEKFGNMCVAILKSRQGTCTSSHYLTRKGTSVNIIDNLANICEEDEHDDGFCVYNLYGDEDEEQTVFRAVVLGSTMTTIEVLLEEMIRSTSVDLVVESSASSYRRMDCALSTIGARETFLAESVAYGKTKFPATPGQAMLPPFNKRLDAGQTDAVEFALREPISVIHGPPGTGKTSVLVEIIRQFSTNYKRVLVCAASNAALDNIIERVRPHYRTESLSRLGHPGRIAPSALEVSVEVKKRNQFTGERKTKSVKKRMRAVVQDRLISSELIFATLDLAGAKILSHLDLEFDVVIIDEVSQATLAQAIVPICWNRGIDQMVLAGDPKQLPPTVLSKNPKSKQVLEVTLFDLLVSFYGNNVVKLLDTQYRMSDAIMRFSAERMYDDMLKAAACVQRIDLYDLQAVNRDPYLRSPIVFIDTKGTCPEEKQEGSNSMKNSGEADLVHRYVSRLLRSGLDPRQIGVIAPYGSQTAILRRMLPGIDVSTVDGFQGQEREAIVMTMVRSNAGGHLGFLKDERRLNVAITRAKRHLCVIGDAATLASNKTLCEWTGHIKQNHDTRCPENMFSHGLEDDMAGLAL